MTLLEIYKSRKDNLALRIKESKSLYETGSVLSEAFETMQYQYLSQGDNDTLTDQLTALVNMAKASFPMIESVNKYRLWEKAEEGKEPKKKSPVPGLVAVLIALTMIYGSLGYYMFTKNIKFADMQTYFAVIGGGCLVLLVAGFMLFHRKKTKLKATVEISVDADDLLKKVEDIVVQIDEILVSVKAEKQTTATQLANAIETAINRDEVQLFSYLMEAKYSGEADFALEQLDEVEHYLAKQDVLLVNYTKGNERYFEFLEGEETKTIRPAFVRKGEVLIKGLAQLKEETQE